MPYNDNAGRVRSWLHRKGIARRVNSSFMLGRYTQCTVETSVPCEWLARVATRWATPHAVAVQRIDRWCWRWTFRP